MASFNKYNWLLIALTSKKVFEQKRFFLHSSVSDFIQDKKWVIPPALSLKFSSLHEHTLFLENDQLVLVPYSGTLSFK
jgi:hypothetical protein